MDLRLEDLLTALNAMKAGNFAYRLPDGSAGLAGEVCQAFNALAADNERLAKQLLPDTAAEQEAAIAQRFEARNMETIGRLTGGVAHDFNNLLMVILASLALLEKQLPEDDRSRKLLESARMGARRGSALTQRLLAFARRQDLNPEPLELAALLEGMNTLFERALGAGVTLAFDMAPGLAKILADANQLELALLNVALNARDAMPDGGRMTIEAHEVPSSLDARLKPGGYVMISLTDNGCGMDEATLSRAAEPFFTTKPAGKGTGLGLSMIEGLAAQSGGLLRLRSAKGSGTTVELLLPKAPAMCAQREEQVSGATGGNAGASTLLVVDDDPLVLAGTAGLVENLGHVAVAARSGDEALSLLAGGLEVKAVITDYQMPSMNGLDLALALHAKYPHTPVILMSGYIDVGHEQGWQWLGRLRKPCSQQDIGRAIDAVVDARAGSALPG